MTKRDDGRPKPLSDALASYLKDSGLEERVEAAMALPEWEARVGEGIAKVTRPIRVAEDGTLLVAVRSSAWMMELRMMEREIVGRLNAGRKRGRISAIRFLIDGGEGGAAGPGR